MWGLVGPRALGLLAVLLLHLAPLPTSATGMGVGRKLSAAQCVAEVRGLDKVEGFRKLCFSLSQVSRQLAETERGERHWLGSAKIEDARIRSSTEVLQAKAKRLDASVAKERSAEAKSEQLSLTLEELQMFYDRQKKQLSQDETLVAEEAHHLKQAVRKEAVAERAETAAERKEGTAEARLRAAEVQHQQVAANLTVELREEAKEELLTKSQLSKLRADEDARCDRRIRRSMSLLSRGTDLEVVSMKRALRKADGMEGELASLKAALAAEQGKRAEAEKARDAAQRHADQAEAQAKQLAQARADDQAASEKELNAERSTCEGRVRDAISQCNAQAEIAGGLPEIATSR